MPSEQPEEQTSKNLYGLVYSSKIDLYDTPEEAIGDRCLLDDTREVLLVEVQAIVDTGFSTATEGVKRVRYV